MSFKILCRFASLFIIKKKQKQTLDLHPDGKASGGAQGETKTSAR